MALPWSCCGCIVNMGNVPFLLSFRSDGVGTPVGCGSAAGPAASSCCCLKIKEEQDLGSPNHGLSPQRWLAACPRSPAGARKCLLMFNLHVTRSSHGHGQPCSPAPAPARPPHLPSPAALVPRPCRGQVPRLCRGPLVWWPPWGGQGGGARMHGRCLG